MFILVRDNRYKYDRTVRRYGRHGSGACQCSEQGNHNFMKFGDVPSWVDRVCSSELICSSMIIMAYTREDSGIPYWEERMYQDDNRL